MRTKSDKLKKNPLEDFLLTVDFNFEPLIVDLIFLDAV